MKKEVRRIKKLFNAGRKLLNRFNYFKAMHTGYELEYDKNAPEKMDSLRMDLLHVKEAIENDVGEFIREIDTAIDQLEKYRKL